MIMLLPIYGKHVLHLDAEHMGLLMLSSGIGSVIGSLAIMFLPRAGRQTVISVTMVLICAALISLSKADGFLWPAVTLVCLALGVSTLVGLANTIVQERSPAEIRGRVSAIAGLSFFGFLPFAGLIMGWFADHFGVRPALFYSAVAYAIIGSAVLIWGRRGMNREVAA
jgi:MFS family permease